MSHTAGPDLVNLRQSLAELVNESKSLRIDLGLYERSRRRGTLINMAFTVIAVLAIALVGWIAYQNNELTANIRSCTTPGQQCYQEGRKLANANTDRVVQSAIFAAQCQKSTKDEKELEECVAAKIEKAATSAPRPK